MLFCTLRTSCSLKRSGLHCLGANLHTDTAMVIHEKTKNKKSCPAYLAWGTGCYLGKRTETNWKRVKYFYADLKETVKKKS